MLSCRLSALIILVSVAWGLPCLGQSDRGEPAIYQISDSALAGTTPLYTGSDIASVMIDGVDLFLNKQLKQSVADRRERWPVDDEEVEQLREEYRVCIGLVDPRVDRPTFRSDSPLRTSGAGVWTMSPDATFDGGKVYQVEWPMHEGLDAKGLLVVPDNSAEPWSVVLVPDAGQMPEDLCGYDSDKCTAIEFALQGATVLVPQVVSRHREPRNGRAVLTDQEYLYRSAFVLGRHLLGHHVQQCIAGLEALEDMNPNRPVAIAGWGEGGWIALAAGASEPRFDAVLVSGHFGPREKLWSEPIHRNVHGLLTSFGDAQLAALIAPRTLIIDAIPGPQIEIGGKGGAPGRLQGPTLEASESEYRIAQELLRRRGLGKSMEWHQSPAPYAAERPTQSSILRLVDTLHRKDEKRPNSRPSLPQEIQVQWNKMPDRELRRTHLLNSWDRYQQRLLQLASIERDAYWKNLDTSSVDRFQETIEPYRREFREKIIGTWDMDLMPLNPRTRLVFDHPKWLGYEVVLDVFDTVLAFGVLLVPKSEQPIEQRPCVVFQHGLEGRPNDTITGDHPAYHDVAARLAEEGYVVFAPQNLYLFTDRFRVLQRKSNPLGKTLFSTMVAQHEQIVRWLASRPEIDPKRIAFYGLSYGGKSAMRIPALVPGYCLSICSADFNDWVWKNASTSSPYSYVWTMEYEIFEFDLGRKFNYAEMAALIAPRPFMVERGHFDGVAPDERVALEYAKVRNLYAAKLNIPEQTEIEWFVGPHTIHGKGTFAFLKKHLGPVSDQ
jgi:dienelactone hydrolase